MVYERIRRTLATHGRLAVDPMGVDRNADLYEHGLTSHASVNLMIGLEDEFGIEFPDDALKKSTFASITRIAEVISTLSTSAA
ncbi:MAG TPA: acyl carrier protein [Mycobacterium sp.]|nr:acyl carrier protein [Mycobacterium sp.]HKP42762.1 acyl carrier protein [Mycobacterium sp.]